MLPLTRRTARSLALCATALSLGGAGVAVAAPPTIFVPQTPAQATVSSGGVKFLAAGQTKKLGRAGHFTFSATCSKVDGQNQATFDVTADTVAALDGNAPAPARTLVNIHTNSDALDMKAPGEFDQVGSASSSTSIAKDGQEVDVFYTDGVNWPAMPGVGGVPGVAGLERLGHGPVLVEVAVGPGVPHDHGTGPVALADHALEVGVVERVVLHLDREALLARVGRGSLRHRPRAQRPVDLEPEVVVEPRGVVLLDHEARVAAPGAGRRLGGVPHARLVRDAAAALVAVPPQSIGHGRAVPGRQESKRRSGRRQPPCGTGRCADGVSR